jgi:hypothetical protein
MLAQGNHEPMIVPIENALIPIEEALLGAPIFLQVIFIILLKNIT